MPSIVLKRLYWMQYDHSDYNSSASPAATRTKTYLSATGTSAPPSLADVEVPAGEPVEVVPLLVAVAVVPAVPLVPAPGWPLAGPGTELTKLAWKTARAFICCPTPEVLSQPLTLQSDPQVLLPLPVQLAAAALALAASSGWIWSCLLGAICIVEVRALTNSDRYDNWSVLQVWSGSQATSYKTLEFKNTLLDVSNPVSLSTHTVDALV
jgi:hypothetical protein